jgi:hypothetical protein
LTFLIFGTIIIWKTLHNSGFAGFGYSA